MFGTACSVKMEALEKAFNNTGRVRLSETKETAFHCLLLTALARLSACLMVKTSLATADIRAKVRREATKMVHCLAILLALL